jgi:succinyl-CoA synthetase beta subunit
VALGLDDAAAVIAAAEDMARQNAAPDGYLVEEMIGISLAELLIGVVADPAHGFLLTIGAGGIMTELIEDHVTLILPISEDDVRLALRQLAIAPLFDGFRGKPPADRKAVIDVVMAIQSYVRTHRSSMQELEINPLIVAQNGATAVDALIRQGETI